MAFSTYADKWNLKFLSLAMALATLITPAAPYERPLPRKAVHTKFPAKFNTYVQQERLKHGLFINKGLLVHTSLAGKNKMRVSWVTKTRAPSIVFYGTLKGQYKFKAKGTSATYRFKNYKSGFIHDVVIGPLQPSTTYFYRCGQIKGTEYNFKTPPAAYPLKFAVLGDLGQVKWAKSTLKNVGKSGYDVFLLPGDVSYADFNQHKWDSFGRFVQPFASKRPWMVTVGNHDVEKIPGVHPKTFTAYNARWHMPFEESHSPSNLFYSFDVAGAHVTVLGSYTDFEKTSKQYKWLEADLKSVDRTKTPWLFVMLHAPWYNSNKEHQGEHVCVGMKAAMEHLIYAAKVDAVLVGHVHAYERFTRVFDGKAQKCGPVHITIGSSGHNVPDKTYLDPKPSISLFREASYGHGELVLVNGTHARWTYHRNVNHNSTIADSVWLHSLVSDPACK